MKKEIPMGRVLVYFLGLVSYACGACLATKAALGLTPVTSISYVLSLATEYSLGTVMLLYNVVLLLVERLLYGKAFQRRQYLQLPLSVFFSMLIDLCMYFFRHLDGVALPHRCLFFLAAMALMGLGIAGTVCGALISLPAEGVVQAVAFRFGLEFSRTKLGHDCVVVALTVGLSLLLLGRLEGIQVGTLLSALLLGPISRLWMNAIHAWVGLTPDVQRK